jgi:hypothetical protein
VRADPNSEFSLSRPLNEQQAKKVSIAEERNGEYAGADVINEFKRSLEGRRPSTIRLYVAGARAAMEAAMAVSGRASFPEILVSIREMQPGTRARVAPFLRFLREVDGTANNSLALQDALGIQYWVIQTLAKRMRTQKNPSIAARRDMALIASLSSAPARGNPRNWAQSCLKIDGARVHLWEQIVEEPAFALALRFWSAWRERLARPDQRRLYRKALEWSESKLLFPGPRGGLLGRAALHNALRRLVNGLGEGRCPQITPQKIKAAFLAADTFTASSRSGQGSDGLAPL